MNIFRELEGTRQEIMATAGLRYLLLTSHFARETVVDFLSEKSPAGPLYSDIRFGAYAEAPTEDDSSDAEQPHRGRIDLLIETDDAIVGIESKFHAQFQDDQPHKYAKTLEKWRRSMSDRYGVGARAILFVLSPKQRAHEINERIQDAASKLEKNEDIQVAVAALHWDDLTEKLETGMMQGQAEEGVRIILKDYIRFVRSHVAFFPDVTKHLPHWTKPFAQTGPRWEHWKVLEALKSIFPSAGNISWNTSKPHRYYGFPAWKDGPWHDGRWVWLGFIDGHDFGRPTEGTLAVVVGRAFRDAFDGNQLGLKLTRFTEEGAGRWNLENEIWEVPLDSAFWTHPSSWRSLVEYLKLSLPKEMTACD